MGATFLHWEPITRDSESNKLILLLFFISTQVLSGDSVVIRGQPRGGPPPERQLCLSNVNAPKMARRPNPNVEGSVETRDEVHTCYITTLFSDAVHCCGFLHVTRYFTTFCLFSCVASFLKGSN